jgi:hypothetical protein
MTNSPTDTGLKVQVVASAPSEPPNLADLAEE